MASLAEGQKYGLSSHDKNLNKKTLIFVKLTDSSLKSIEEYVNAKPNSVLKPTIQFQSNNGVIRLPNTDSHYKSYGFSLSSVEVDGPQGSFECLRQEGSKSLESLGCMLLKMHINANEDSYEKTRVKMAAVEKENKKFCTKEIKPSGPYVGRKVKVKRSITSIPPKPPSPLYMSQPPKHSSKPFSSPISLSANQLSCPVNTARQVNSNNRNTKNMPEIIKQSCRSRIIHLLALRPYKKPELFIKLGNEGIKDKEKISIVPILTQVAVQGKDHSFSLHKNAWQDVQDDWKFYTPEEAQTVKAKKYNILNHGNESGTSSPADNHQSQSPNQKRTLSEWETNNYDQRHKRQRISHLNRVNNTTSNSTKVETNGSMNNGSPNINSHSNIKKDMNGHVRTNGNIDDHSSQKSSDSWNYSKMNGVHSQPKHVTSDNEKLPLRRTPSPYLKNGVISQNDKSNHPHWVSASQKNNNRDWSPNQKNILINGDSRKVSDSRSVSPVEKTAHIKEEKQNHPHFGRTNGYVPPQPVDSQSKSYYIDDDDNPDPDLSPTLERSSSNGLAVKPYSNGYHHNGYTNGDYFSTQMVSHPTVRVETKSEEDNSFNSDEGDDDLSDRSCDYLRQYTQIFSKDQRTRYKEDFNSDYEEYKRLHNELKIISNRFIELENIMKCVNHESDEYENTKRKILIEYKKVPPWYNEAKKKLDFLHDKLSHIKRLVVEFDQSQRAVS